MCNLLRIAEGILDAKEYLAENLSSWENVQLYAENGCDEYLTKEECQLILACITRWHNTENWSGQLYYSMVEEPLTMTKEDWLAQADSRETSEEIMASIWKITGGDWYEADNYWTDGPSTSGEIQQLCEIATNNGQLGQPSDFVWGEAGSNWWKK